MLFRSIKFMAKTLTKKSQKEFSFEISKEEQESFRKKLDVIIFGFAHHFPFFGSVSERCRYSLTRDALIPTAGIDKNGHIIFNLDFVNTLDNKQFLFLVAHEISHFIFQHSDRMLKRDPMLWNVAADYAINLFLYYQFGSKEYFPMIEKICFDKDWNTNSSDNRYDKMNVEQIYNIIEKEAQKLPKIKIDIFGSFGDEDENGEDGGGDGDGEGENKPKYVDIRGRRVPLPNKKGKSKEQVSREMKDYINRAISDAYNVAKSQGSLPAGMERIIISHLRPKIDWLSKLREKLRFGTDRLSRADSNWSVPNKRFLDKDYVFPSYHGPNTPKIAYAIDTSGSMSEDDLKIGRAHV